MRTCEDGCNGCDECTDYGDDQGHRPPRYQVQPELALFFRDLRNYLLHVIDMSKGEHYLDVVRLNAQALIRRMELLAASAHPVAPAGWKLVPVELTPEMRMAFHAVVDTVELGAAGSRWAAMLAAAPAQPEAL